MSASLGDTKTNRAGLPAVACQIVQRNVHDITNTFDVEILVGTVILQAAATIVIRRAQLLFPPSQRMKWNSRKD
jgi:hypothetical protein